MEASPERRDRKRREPAGSLPAFSAWPSVWGDPRREQPSSIGPTLLPRSLPDRADGERAAAPFYGFTGGLRTLTLDGQRAHLVRCGEHCTETSSAASVTGREPSGVRRRLQRWVRDCGRPLSRASGCSVSPPGRTGWWSGASSSSHHWTGRPTARGSRTSTMGTSTSSMPTAPTRGTGHDAEGCRRRGRSVARRDALRLGERRCASRDRGRRAPIGRAWLCRPDRRPSLRNGLRTARGSPTRSGCIVWTISPDGEQREGAWWSSRAVLFEAHCGASYRLIGCNSPVESPDEQAHAP